MTRWFFFPAAGFSLLAGVACAQNLGSSPQAMPGAAPAMPGAMASPAPMGAAPPSLTMGSGGGAATPDAGMPGAASGGLAPLPPGASKAAGGGATAGIVGLRGAMIARKGTVYETLDVGATTQAFMTIENQSSNPDNLTSVDCTIADSTTIVGSNGKNLASVPVNPGTPLVFAAAGVHVVLRNIHYTIPDAVTVPCSLNFQYAGAIQAFLFAIPKPAPTEP